MSVSTPIFADFPEAGTWTQTDETVSVNVELFLRKRAATKTKQEAMLVL